MEGITNDIVYDTLQKINDIVYRMNQRSYLCSSGIGMDASQVNINMINEKTLIYRNKFILGESDPNIPSEKKDDYEQIFKYLFVKNFQAFSLELRKTLLDILDTGDENSRIYKAKSRNQTMKRTVAALITCAFIVAFIAVLVGFGKEWKRNGAMPDVVRMVTIQSVLVIGIIYFGQEINDDSTEEMFNLNKDILENIIKPFAKHKPILSATVDDEELQDQEFLLQNIHRVFDLADTEFSSTEEFGMKKKIMDDAASTTAYDAGLTLFPKSNSGSWCNGNFKTNMDKQIALTANNSTVLEIANTFYKIVSKLVDDKTFKPVTSSLEIELLEDVNNQMSIIKKLLAKDDEFNYNEPINRTKTYKLILQAIYPITADDVKILDDYKARIGFIGSCRDNVDLNRQLGQLKNSLTTNFKLNIDLKDMLNTDVKLNQADVLGALIFLKKVIEHEIGDNKSIDIQSFQVNALKYMYNQPNSDKIYMNLMMLIRYIENKRMLDDKNKSILNETKSLKNVDVYVPFKVFDYRINSLGPIHIDTFAKKTAKMNIDINQFVDYTHKRGGMIERKLRKFRKNYRLSLVVVIVLVIVSGLNVFQYIKQPITNLNTAKTNININTNANANDNSQNIQQTGGFRFSGKEKETLVSIKTFQQNQLEKTKQELYNMLRTIPETMKEYMDPLKTQFGENNNELFTKVDEGITKFKNIIEAFQIQDDIPDMITRIQEVTDSLRNIANNHSPQMGVGVENTTGGGISTKILKDAGEWVQEKKQRASKNIGLAYVNAIDKTKKAGQWAKDKKLEASENIRSTYKNAIDKTKKAGQWAKDKKDEVGEKIGLTYVNAIDKTKKASQWAQGSKPVQWLQGKNRDFIDNISSSNPPPTDSEPATMLIYSLIGAIERSVAILRRIDEVNTAYNIVSQSDPNNVDEGLVRSKHKEYLRLLKAPLREGELPPVLDTAGYGSTSQSQPPQGDEPPPQGDEPPPQDDEQPSQPSKSSRALQAVKSSAAKQAARSSAALQAVSNELSVHPEAFRMDSEESVNAVLIKVGVVCAWLVLSSFVINYWYKYFGKGESNNVVNIMNTNRLRKHVDELAMLLTDAQCGLSTGLYNSSLYGLQGGGDGTDGTETSASDLLGSCLATSPLIDDFANKMIMMVTYDALLNPHVLCIFDVAKLLSNPPPKYMEGKDTYLAANESFLDKENKLKIGTTSHGYKMGETTWKFVPASGLEYYLQVFGCGGSINYYLTYSRKKLILENDLSKVTKWTVRQDAYKNIYINVGNEFLTISESYQIVLTNSASCSTYWNLIVTDTFEGFMTSPSANYNDNTKKYLSPNGVFEFTLSSTSGASPSISATRYDKRFSPFASESVNNIPIPTTEYISFTNYGTVLIGSSTTYMTSELYYTTDPTLTLTPTPSGAGSTQFMISEDQTKEKGYYKTNGVSDVLHIQKDGSSMFYVYKISANAKQFITQVSGPITFQSPGVTTAKLGFTITVEAFSTGATGAAGASATGGASATPGTASATASAARSVSATPGTAASAASATPGTAASAASASAASASAGATPSTSSVCLISDLTGGAAMAQGCASQTESEKMEMRKKWYEKMIEVVETFDRCNFIRYSGELEPFPTGEFMMNGIILLLCILVIMYCSYKIGKFVTRSYVKKQADDMKEKNRVDAISNNLAFQMAAETNNQNTVPDGGVPQKGGGRVRTFYGGDQDQAQAQAQYDAMNKLNTSTFLETLQQEESTYYSKIMLMIVTVILSVVMSYSMIKNMYFFTNNAFSGARFRSGVCG